MNIKKLIALLLTVTALSCKSTDTNSPDTPTGTLRITEVLPNPVGEDKGNEAITLKNVTSNSAISLTGWQFRSKGIGSAFAVTTSATPITLTAGTSWSTTTFPFDRAWLNNDGDSLFLINPSGVTVHAVGWGKVGDGEVVKP